MNRRRIAAVLATTLALGACHPTARISENDAALARAMALSTDESAAIVKQLRALAAANEGQRTYRGEAIPSQLRVLEPMSVVVSKKISRVNLSGTGDDQVYLLLRDSDSSPGGKRHGELIIVKGKNYGSTTWWWE